MRIGTVGPQCGEAANNVLIDLKERWTLLGLGGPWSVRGQPPSRPAFVG